MNLKCNGLPVNVDPVVLHLLEVADDFLNSGEDALAARIIAEIYEYFDSDDQVRRSEKILLTLSDPAPPGGVKKMSKKTAGSLERLEQF